MSAGNGSAGRIRVVFDDAVSADPPPLFVVRLGGIDHEIVPLSSGSQRKLLRVASRVSAARSLVDDVGSEAWTETMLDVLDARTDAILISVPSLAREQIDALTDDQIAKLEGAIDQAHASRTREVAAACAADPTSASVLPSPTTGG